MCLVKECTVRFPVSNDILSYSACVNVAAGYVKSLERGGNLLFHRAQAKSCMCKPPNIQDFDEQKDACVNRYDVLPPLVKRELINFVE